MKNQVRVCSIIILFLAFWQIRTGQNTGSVTDTELLRLGNGKYALIKTTGGSEAFKPVGFPHPGMKSGTENSVTRTRSQTITPIYHIKFNFNAPCDMLMCNGTDTMFMSFWNLYWTGSNTLEGDMPEGYYLLYCELQTFSIGGFDTLYLIYQKDFHVYKNLDTTILTASANHNLTLNALDENGIPIPYLKKDGDGFGFINEFHEQYHIILFNHIFSGVFDPAFRISSTPAEVKIISSRTDVSKYEPYHQYLISWPPLINISSDTSLTNDPAEMKHFSFKYHPSPASEDSYYAWGYGTVINDSLMGMVDTFVGAFISDDYPGTSNTVHVYISGTACDTNKAFFAALVDHLECDPDNNCNLHDMFGPIYYLDPSNVLILSSNGNYPPVDGDYRVEEENTIPFGNTAPFNVCRNYTEPGSCMLEIWQHFKGQTNERRNIDMMTGTWDIWQDNNHLWHDSIISYHITYGVPVTGIYTLVLNDSNYEVCGIPGYLRAEMTMDVGSNDPVSPTLQAFKILIGDSIRTEVIHGYPASVKFTASDLTLLEPDPKRRYHILAHARFYLKAYDDTSWVELPVIPLTNLLDSLCGMPYYADIEQPLSLFPDSTMIDFKIELIDSAGNSTVQIMHPACLVRDALVGREQVPSPLQISIYPNPVHDKLYIRGGESDLTIGIFSVTGQKLLEVTNTREIDVSGLKKGIFFIQVTSHKSGQTGCFKLIK
jgi:hypothetical protein